MIPFDQPGGVPVLTLWQPWATLLADPTLPKRIETRPKAWPSTIPLPAWALIHAAAREPEALLRAGNWHVSSYGHLWSMVPIGNCMGTQYVERPLPLGAIVGAVRFTDSLPIVDKDDPTRGAHLLIGRQPPHDLLIARPTRGYHSTSGKLYDHFEWATEKITDQLPYGDFRPGRWAWLTDHQHALPEPIPWKGSQGFPRATPELLAQVNEQLS